MKSKSILVCIETIILLSSERALKQSPLIPRTHILHIAHIERNPFVENISYGYHIHEQKRSILHGRGKCSPKTWSPKNVQNIYLYYIYLLVEDIIHQHRRIRHFVINTFNGIDCVCMLMRPRSCASPLLPNAFSTKCVNTLNNKQQSHLIL